MENWNEMGKCWMQTWSVAVSDHSQLSGYEHDVDTPPDLPTGNLHSSPPFSPPSLAIHRQEFPECVLSRQHRPQKPSCTPMGGGEHLEVQHSEATPSFNPLQSCWWQPTSPNGQRKGLVFPSMKQKYLVSSCSLFSSFSL